MLNFEKETHRYFLDQTPIPGVNEVMEEMGMIDLQGVPIDLLAYKADLGDRVHVHCHKDDFGILDDSEVQNDAWPYLNAYRSFKQDKQPVLLFSEIPMHSQTGFAGRPDRGFIFDSATWYVDLKTGNQYRTHRLCTAAYNTILGYQRRGCLYLKDDGSYCLKEHTETEDYEIWGYLVRCFHYKKPRYSKGRVWNFQSLQTK